MKRLALSMIIVFSLFIGSAYSELNESPDHTANITHSKKWLFITVPTDLVFRINDTNVSVSEINISILNAVNNIEVTVVKYLETPPGVTPPENTVKEYFSINRTILEDSNIGSFTLTFRISREWMDYEKVNASTVIIKRYLNNTWKPMLLTYTGEDTDYTYFETSNPGFNLFAITGERMPDIQPDIICSVGEMRCLGNFSQICNQTNWVNAEKCDYECRDGICIPKPVDYITPSLIIISIIVAVYLIWRYRTRILGLRPVNRERIYDRLKKE